MNTTMKLRETTSQHLRGLALLLCMAAAGCSGDAEGRDAEDRDAASPGQDAGATDAEVLDATGDSSPPDAPGAPDATDATAPDAADAPAEVGLDAGMAQPWRGRFGGVGEDVVRHITVDGDGNTYATGYFTDTADLDPGDQELELVAKGQFDAFVQKISASGELLWARRFGGSDFEYGTSVATDLDGNVYVAGTFADVADFDPDNGGFSMKSSGHLDAFLVKLDSDGEFVWAKSFGGPEYDEPTAVEVDDAGAVYLSGYFNGTADFDPGAAVTAFTAEQTDGFVAKLDGQGELLWARQFGGPEGDFALAMDVQGATGATYVTGMFSGAADFDPGDEEYLLEPETAGNVTAFYLVLDEAGNFDRAGQMSGVSASLGRDIEVDTEGNVFVAGTFAGTADFDPTAGTTELTSEGFEDAFLMKLEPTGALAWAGQLAGPHDVIAYDLSVDLNGDVYASGYFFSTCDFDPGDETYELSNETGNAMAAFLVKLDSDGQFLRAWDFGGVNFADYHGAAVGLPGHVSIAGAFENTVDIDPEAGETEQVTSLGFRDSYIIHMLSNTL